MSLAWRIEPADLGGAIRASRWRAGGAEEHPLGPALRHVAIGLGRLLMRLSIAVAVRRSLALATMVPGGGGRERQRILLLATAGDKARARRVTVGDRRAPGADGGWQLHCFYW